MFYYQRSVLSEDFQLAQFQGLAGLRGLTARFVHQLDDIQHTGTCPSGLTLGTTMAGVKFFHPVSGKVLNYQLVTFDSRGFAFDGLWWSYQAGSGEQVFGVNDSVQTYGMGSFDRGAGTVL